MLLTETSIILAISFMSYCW